MYSKIYIGKKQVEMLIKEVKSKPALYDSASQGYRDRRYKTLLWNEISSKLGYSVNDCKKKWKGLRDSYVRNIKDESLNKTPKGKLKKDYIFFKHLHFLLPFVLNKEKTITSTEENNTICKYENILNDHNSQDKLNYPTTSLNEKLNINDSQICEIIVMPDQIDELIDDKNRIKNENNDSLENELQPTSIIDNVNINLNQENQHYDKNEMDEDSLYFQSLIPSFKKLSSEDRSWIKLKLMEMIHEKLYGRS